MRPCELRTVLVTADSTDQMGRAPLHYAALEGRAEQVRALLTDGADVSATDKQAFTALHFACQQNRDLLDGLPARRLITTNRATITRCVAPLPQSS